MGFVKLLKEFMLGLGVLSSIPLFISVAFGLFLLLQLFLPIILPILMVATVMAFAGGIIFGLWLIGNLLLKK